MNVRPEVTRERMYIDAIEEVMANNSKVMLDADSSGSLMYLPLDKLMSRSGSGSSGSATSVLNNNNIVNRDVLDEFRKNTSRSRSREVR